MATTARTAGSAGSQVVAAACPPRLRRIVTPSVSRTVMTLIAVAILPVARVVAGDRHPSWLRGDRGARGVRRLTGLRCPVGGRA